MYAEQCTCFVLLIKKYYDQEESLNFNFALFIAKLSNLINKYQIYTCTVLTY